METKFAIIDLGSNSVRMMIMKIYNDFSYKMMDEVKEMVRLSEDMGKEKTLKPNAINRTIKALKLFHKLVEVHQVDRVYPIATAAVRNASNQREFLEEVKRETGFSFQVISGEMEAYYGYLGVINTIDIEECIIVDVGGGSTELVWVENREIKESISFPFGAVTLTEEYGEKKEISTQKLKQLEDVIKKKFSKIPWLKKATGIPVVGLGGTARTIAKVNKNKIKFPLVSLHNYQMSNGEMLEAYKKIVEAKYHQRKNIPGVNRERADIIVGGLVPIKCLVQYLKANKLIISGNGLREGVFFENYIKECHTASRIIKDVLNHSLNNVLRNYDANMKHSYHVQKLALSIFDQTMDLHGLGQEERKLLSVGSLLHDIGNYVDYYNHHRHGFYLVLNSRINGLRNRELVICAFIVAMHREIDHRKDWKPYQMLIDKKDFEAVKKLSIFVNIAEELDRNEHEAVENIQCFVEGEVVKIKVISLNNPQLEIEAALRAQKDFKKIFNKRLEIY